MKNGSTKPEKVLGNLTTFSNMKQFVAPNEKVVFLPPRLEDNAYPDGRERINEVLNRAAKPKQ